MNSEQLIDAIGNIDDELIINAKTKKRRFGIVRKLTIAVAILFCVTMPLPVMEVFGSETAYSMMYMVSPEIAQKFKPVQKSCTDKGIQMEVISADIDGNKASIFIALQDTESDRIDKTIDLFDSYRINCPFDSIGNCTFSHYDEETKTAYFVVNIETMKGEILKKDKITFSVSKLLYGKEETNGYINADLAETAINPQMMNITERNGGSWYGEEPKWEDVKCLIPNDTADIPVADGVTLTGLGYVNGELHIQTYYEDISKTDNHGIIYLENENGELDGFDKKAYCVSFFDSEHYGSYNELIIPTEYDKLGEYKLYGEFVTSKGCTEGNWSVTFNLE